MQILGNYFAKIGYKDTMRGIEVFSFEYTFLFNRYGKKISGVLVKSGDGFDINQNVVLLL
jgi:hypothetical protein